MRLYIIGGIAVVETVNIDLVHNRASGPLRGMKAGNDAEHVIVLQFPGYALNVIEEADFTYFDFEIIFNRLIGRRNLALVEIEIIVAVDLAHGKRIAF